LEGGLPAVGETRLAVEVEDWPVDGAQDVDRHVGTTGDVEGLGPPRERNRPVAEEVARRIRRVDRLDERVDVVEDARGDRHGEGSAASDQDARARGRDDPLRLVAAAVEADLPEEARDVEPGLGAAEQERGTARREYRPDQDR